MPTPKSIATAELLAWIITSQYCDALLLYRQGFILKRMDVEISRATMADWVIRSSALLEPRYIDRKNWLFAHSVKGANASAILYSLVETAKEIGCYLQRDNTPLINEWFKS